MVVSLTFIISAFALSGCGMNGEKNGSITFIYGVTALISLVLLLTGSFLVRQRKPWFFLLFSSVLTVNIGYTWLSASGNLALALMANRLSYLGSVFLPLAMLMIILEVTHTTYKKAMPISLFFLAFLIFLITASPGILDIYYESVSLQVIDGVSRLSKVYGVLHPLYLLYLLGYFGSMIWVIIRARLRKSLGSLSHGVILAIAVLINIGVWLAEQLSPIGFEMLSISYIISEAFLLGIHIVMNENQRLREQVDAIRNMPEVSDVSQPLLSSVLDPHQVELYIEGLSLLTPTEKAVYDAHVSRLNTKEILAKLQITENTLKYHNKNLYGKLGVSSKKQLQEIHKYLKTQKELLSNDAPFKN